MHNADSTRRSKILIVAALLVLGLFVLGPALVSRVLGNIGLVTLNRALAVSPDVRTLEALVREVKPKVGSDTKLIQTLALAVRADSPDPYVLAEAERWLTLAVAWDENNVGAHCGLGWIWDTRGHLNKAAKEWHKGGFTTQDFLACAETAAYIKWNGEAQRWRKRAAALSRVENRGQ